MNLGQKIIDSIRNKNKKKDTYYLKSFSQTGEDVIIWYIFKALHFQNFSWLDIGAHHPSYLSNTALFYEHGYRGINIEADPGLIGLIKFTPQQALQCAL